MTSVTVTNHAYLQPQRPAQPRSQEPPTSGDATQLSHDQVAVGWLIGLALVWAVGGR